MKNKITARKLSELNLRYEKDESNNSYSIFYEEQLINSFENEEDAHFSINQLLDFFTKGFINGAVAKTHDSKGTDTVLKEFGVPFEIDFSNN